MHTAISRLQTTSEAIGISLHAVSGIHFFYTPQLPLLDRGLFVIDASRSHTDTRQSVGLLWTSNRPIYLTTHNRKTSMPPVGFEPEIPETELPHTQAPPSGLAAAHRH
jgi:hypothetical protein